MNRISCIAFALLASCLVPTSSSAQTGQRTVPTNEYFRSFNDFYGAEYSRAARDFRSAARGGYIDVNGPWIDSVCYHTMIGECALNVGDVTLAMDQYNTALQVFMANGQWLPRVEFSDTIAPSNSAVSRARINWGTTSREAIIGQFPSSFSVLVGNLEGIEEGGVIRRPELRSVNVGEIMRCLALSMRRRVEILGPTAVHDELNGAMVDALNRSGIGQDQWARAWVDISLAIGMIGQGEGERAAAMLQNAIQLPGGIDHPLSAVAMLELGKLYYRAERYDDAMQLFFESTLSAAIYEQHDVLEEAFYWGTNSHLAAGNVGEFPPLASALTWAQRDGSKQLIASLAIQMAECHLAAGDSATASSLLSPVARTMRGNEISKSPIGARYLFQTAHVSFQQGNGAAGVVDLAKCMELQRLHSRRLLQVTLTDQMFVNGLISHLKTNELFEHLLRDPTAVDWQLSPMESMSMLLIPHPIPMEHWFEIAVSRNDHEQAIEIADRIRRKRFYATQPLGGRVMSLRWVLEAPSEAISQAGNLQRQDFRLRYPEFGELSDRSKTIVDQLRLLPLLPEPDADERAQQARLFEELQQISGIQEVLLSDVAMRREPSEFEFPPLRETGMIQQALDEKQILISYFGTSNALYVFKLTKDSYDIDRIDRHTTIKRDIVQIMRGIGNMERNHALDEEVFEDDSWRNTARLLGDRLLSIVNQGEWQSYDELIVVPDGPLWYLPFEILEIGDEGSSTALIDHVNIRYLPTVGLAVPDGRKNRAVGNLAVVTGKLFPRDEVEVAQESFANIVSDTPAAVQFENTLHIPSSMLNVIVDRLLVLDDMDDARDGPYSVAPMQLDVGRAGSDLSAWMALPFGGVDQIALPGFHTASESALRQRNAEGNEIFLAVCGIMSSGTRTALISRWRPGGQSSHELMREFIRELPNESASNAWRRSLDLSWRGDIIPDLEPRIEESAIDTELDPKHPFFWAGYMLIDTGVHPVED